MTLIPITKEEIEKNLDFVIYNYLAKKEKITVEKAIEDFKSEYDIDLAKKEVNKIFSEFVRDGLLSPRLRYFAVCY